MHELSIAQSIVDIIEQYVPQEHRHTIHSIKVRIGDLAGVVPDSLAFSFTAVTAGTPIAHALLEIEHIPFVLHCTECLSDSTTEPGLAICPRCQSTHTQILSGTELQVVAIELEDENPERL